MRANARGLDFNPQSTSRAYVVAVRPSPRNDQEFPVCSDHRAACHPPLAHWVTEQVRAKRVSVDQISTDDGLHLRVRSLTKLHLVFLNQCRAVGQTSIDYPFNTDHMGIRLLAAAPTSVSTPVPAVRPVDPVSTAPPSAIARVKATLPEVESSHQQVLLGIGAHPQPARPDLIP